MAQKSFLEILGDTIREELRAEMAAGLRPSPPASAPESAAVNWEWHLSQTPRFQFHRPATYPRPAKRPIEPPAHLNVEQLVAWHWFSRQGETLPNLTTSTLKQAFRRLALRLHPDRVGGDASAFRELLSAQHTLAEAITN